MFTKIYTSGLAGINGQVITVEADVSSSHAPSFCIVGLADIAVRESKERIGAALRNAGYVFPGGRVTVNLAPADIKKEGTLFDLPIALALLISSGQLYPTKSLSKILVIGELSLSGKLRGVRGVLPMVATCARLGFCEVIVPAMNSREASLASSALVLAAKSLSEVADHFSGKKPISPYIPSELPNPPDRKDEVDMSEVKGHASVKRAMEIAAAGAHNMLMIGPPGSGKSMLAKRFSTILPEMTEEEKLESTMIHSVAGLLKPEEPLITHRPFRSPHHTATAASLIGGGTYPRPGEVSYAHTGVLFLDEFAEFPRLSLEALRQPIEDEYVTVSRLNATYTYPASFILLASMNPCPCGYYQSENHECRCSQSAINKYHSKISGPILDRIDIISSVEVEKYENLSSLTLENETSAQIRERVCAARNFALNRCDKGRKIFNSQMNVNEIERACVLGKEEDGLIKSAFEVYGLSARSYHRILKLSRTIADLRASEKINCADILEALRYHSVGAEYL